MAARPGQHARKRQQLTLPLGEVLAALHQRLVIALRQRFDKGIIPELDLNQAQVQKEIAAAGLTSGEDEQLEQERLRLKNAEMLYQTVYGSVEELYGAAGSSSRR